MFITLFAAVSAVLSLQGNVPLRCNVDYQGNIVHVSCNDGKGFALAAVYRPDMIGKTMTFAGSELVLQSPDNTLLYDSNQPGEEFFNAVLPEGVVIDIKPK